MPSFDIVSKVDIQEVKNALNYVDKEIATRYDLKGTKAGVVFDEKLLTITLTATDKLQLAAVNELMTQKLAKRGVTVKSLEYKDAESASGDSLRQVVNLKQGIKQEDAKRINQKIKESKLKVTSQIQGDQIRVTGKQRDDLQNAIAMLKEAITDLNLQFTNFRD
jgi:uncharacterized protein YajQ (UPF0234 family)